MLHSVTSSKFQYTECTPCSFPQWQWDGRGHSMELSLLPKEYKAAEGFPPWFLKTRILPWTVVSWTYERIMISTGVWEAQIFECEKLFWTPMFTSSGLQVRRDVCYIRHRWRAPGYVAINRFHLNLFACQSWPAYETISDSIAFARTTLSMWSQ